MSSVLESPSRPAVTMEPLRSGDVMNQETFHRRYEDMPRGLKAELIEGVVYVPSPSTNWHGVYQSTVVGWLFNYCVATPGVQAVDNGTVILDDENEPQPDALLRIASGGSSKLNRKGYIVGAPELHVEIAYASESIDLHQKRRAYEQAGIQEYVVVLVREPAVRFFRLQDQAYHEMMADADGVWRSTVFPGLWLNVHALIKRDGKSLVDTLQRGLESEEHLAFVTNMPPQPA